MLLYRKSLSDCDNATKAVTHFFVSIHFSWCYAHPCVAPLDLKFSCWMVAP